MSHINQWALRWGVRPEAIQELYLALGLDHDIPPAGDLPPMTNEASVLQGARILASRAGGRLWRNNVGAGVLDNGSHVRWGLANDSAAINRTIKSADLIGILPVLVTPQHVGHVIGQFWSVETKAPGWRYTATEREQGQLRWATLIESQGGRASFWNGSGKL